MTVPKATPVDPWAYLGPDEPDRAQSTRQRAVWVLGFVWPWALGAAAGGAAGVWHLWPWLIGVQVLALGAMAVRLYCRSRRAT